MKNWRQFAKWVTNRQRSARRRADPSPSIELQQYSRMSKKRIISRKLLPATLPDFRNLGVILRVLVGTNCVALLLAWLKAPQWQEWIAEFLNIVLWLEPILLAHVLCGYALQPWLQRRSYRQGIAWVLAASAFVSTAIWWLIAQWLAWIGRWSNVSVGNLELVRLDRLIIASLLLTAGFLAYFNLRQRALSPALIEARLQALQARIRPHFLFNSLNGILGLIRSEPRRAEAALEDLSELFRTAMQENRQLTSLGSEIHLCQQYINLEKLRLGKRLEVRWEVEDKDKLQEARIPPFVIQPLVENAVYHGIEPSRNGGVILVRIAERGGFLHILVRNPYHGDIKHRLGNQMAVNNIRERLALHFDAEARVQTKISQESYDVHLTLPYKIG